MRNEKGNVTRDKSFIKWNNEVLSKYKSKGRKHTGKEINRLHKQEKFLYSQEINNQKYMTI